MVRITLIICLPMNGIIVQNEKTLVDVERAVLEEFGRCMTQIINSTQTGKCKGVYLHSSVQINQ